MNFSFYSDYLKQKKNSKIAQLSNAYILSDLSEKNLKTFSFMNSLQYEETRLTQNVKNLNELQTKLEILKNIDWIDLDTQSLFIEFSTINPSIKLFSYNTIKFEFFATGYILNEISFRPMIIFQDELDQPLIFILKIILIIFIFYFFINEIIKLKKKGRKYFKSLESYLELSIIAVFFIGFIFYLLRIHERETVIEIQNTPSKLNLEYLSILNDSIKFSFAFCVSLSFFKLFKLIRFNKQIKILCTGLKINSGLIVSFLLIIFSCYFICVQVFYLLYFEKYSGFSTLSKSMITTVNIILGKIEVKDVLFSNKIGLFIFSAFIPFILLVLLNILIIILNDSLKKGKKQKYDKISDLIFSLMQMLKNENTEKKNKILIKRKYIQPNQYFESAIDTFLVKISKVLFLLF